MRSLTERSLLSGVVEQRSEYVRDADRFRGSSHVVVPWGNQSFRLSARFITSLVMPHHTRYFDNPYAVESETGGICRFSTRDDLDALVTRIGRRIDYTRPDVYAGEPSGLP